MHDYMRDYLSKEFVFVYGKTKEEAAEKAWKKLHKDLGEEISELEFDDELRATKSLFIKRVSKIKRNGDAEFISAPFDLYIQLFKIPESVVTKKGE